MVRRSSGSTFNARGVVFRRSDGLRRGAPSLRRNAARELRNRVAVSQEETCRGATPQPASAWVRVEGVARLFMGRVVGGGGAVPQAPIETAWTRTGLMSDRSGSVVQRRGATATPSRMRSLG